MQASAGLWQSLKSIERAFESLEMPLRLSIHVHVAMTAI